jgi:hypothetical protein
MTTYAMTHDGELIDRVTVKQVRARYSEVPEDADLGELGEFGVFPVAGPKGDAPETDDGEELDVSGPVQREDGSWGRLWVVHRFAEVFAHGKQYARLNGDQYVFPYTFEQFRKDCPEVITRTPPLQQMDGEWGIVEVEETSPPTVGPHQIAEPDGIEKVGGQWKTKWTVRARTSDELAAIEAELLLEIDRAAGQFRLRFITDEPGQALTYEHKAREAAAYAAEPAGHYPILQAEAAASGLSVEVLAAEVAATAAQWRLLAAAIEGTRMGAKRAVRAAETYDGKIAAAQVDWEGLVA